MPSGGFGSWERITILAAGIAQALGAPLLIGAIYDRDYFCDEHIESVTNALRSNLKLATVLTRKEIENYLLIPSALDRAIEKVLNVRGKGLSKDFSSQSLLLEITEPLKSDVLSQLIARKTDFFRNQKTDASALYKVTLSLFERQWSDLNMRLGLVPGKYVLQEFRARIQKSFGVTLTDSRIVEAMRRTEIPQDLTTLLSDMDSFRVARPES